MSLSELRYARLITWKDGAIGRTFSTSSSQRDDIQAQGQSGSNQKSTGVRSVVVSVDCVMALSSGLDRHDRGPAGVLGCCGGNRVVRLGYSPSRVRGCAHAWNEPDPGRGT